MRTVDWKELLGLSGRNAPELIESVEQVQHLPYAMEIEKVMNDFPISGIFCVEKVPQVIILDTRKYDISEIREIHKALWNQGLARILAVVAPDLIRFFSISRTVETDENKLFEEQFLLNAFDAVENAREIESIFYGVESGRIWHDEEKLFDPEKLINRVLLGNLKIAHNELEGSLTTDQTQAALIQTMFIAFLEDRGIIDESYVKIATDNLHGSLIDILESGSVKAFRKLFVKLRKDFNGDLFAAPCSFVETNDSISLNSNIMWTLAQFRSGNLEMETGQQRFQFCSYNFQYIPITLISEVYDSFLSENAKKQQSDGAYYTPVFLAEAVVSSVMERIEETDPEIKDNGIFFDPACGSGVFLVQCFQRLYQRLKFSQRNVSWEELRSIASRMRGCDVDEVAVRVAVFSLYMVMLESECAEKKNRLKVGECMLPKLWNQTLICIDYFKFETGSEKIDVLLSNPPWITKGKGNRSGIDWCKRHGFPMPRLQLAWAFAWKAKLDLSERGLVSMLLPANSFLHNVSDNAVSARQKLFGESFISKVVNFSDLRRQLFDKARYSTAMIQFENLNQEEGDYWFDYWVPKSDLNTTEKQYVTISTLDKKEIGISEVLSEPSIFSQIFWMSEPELKLFSYFGKLPKISRFVMNLNSFETADSKNSTEWVMGGGFQKKYKNKTNYKSKYVGKLPFLPAKNLTNISVLIDKNEKWPSSTVYRRGFERAFLEPRILVSGGIRQRQKRITAAYSSSPTTFLASVFAICFPKNQKDHAKFMTAVLNSKLAMWFLFHSSSAIATSRMALRYEEILNLPLPEPEDFPDDRRVVAKNAKKKLIQLVESKLEEVGELHKKSGKPIENEYQSDDTLLNKIDELVYEYYGLSPAEVVLIEDSIDTVLGVIQPTTSLTAHSFWRRSSKSARTAYAIQLAESLSFWLRSEDWGISVELIAQNDDFGIVRLKICDSSMLKPYKESNRDSFCSVLNKISKSADNFRVRNFHTIPDRRIFAGKYVYLIKPIQQRFWMRSSAIDDANKIAIDVNDYALSLELEKEQNHED